MYNNTQNRSQKSVPFIIFSFGFLYEFPLNISLRDQYHLKGKTSPLEAQSETIHLNRKPRSPEARHFGAKPFVLFRALIPQASGRAFTKELQ